MTKNQAMHELRKNENEISLLNEALEAYGYIQKKQDNQQMSSLDSLKIVLNENDRLKDEMRTLIESAVKDRQTIEYNQRDNIKRMPDILS